MDKVMNWIKSNPLIVACTAIVVLAIASPWLIGLFFQSDLAEDLRQRERQLSRIENLQRSTVELPPSDPYGESQTINTTVNESFMDMLRSVYRQWNTQRDELARMVIRFNHFGPDMQDNPKDEMVLGDDHEPVVEDYFPEPQDDLQYTFRLRSREFLNLMYRSLNAGFPITEDEVLRRGIRMMDIPAASRDDAGQQTQLPDSLDDLPADLADRARIELAQERASTMHVYADPYIFENDTMQAEGFFDVDEWVASDQPDYDLANAWQTQMKLWIQQDLVNAIRMANRTDDAQASVIDAPVKRILNIDVADEYVGITDSLEGEPMEQYPPNPVEPYPDHFGLSVTGRISNPMYDVRLVTLTVYMDAQQIDELIQALSDINLMTVVNMSITEVNEYQELLNGYFYGQTDVVQVELTIETLWMRKWTAGDPTEQKGQPGFDPGLMPDAVRYRLGMQPRDPDAIDTDETQTGNTFDPGMY